MKNDLRHFNPKTMSFLGYPKRSYQVWTLWDHSFFELCCGQTDKQTDRETKTDRAKHSTHVDRPTAWVKRKLYKIIEDRSNSLFSLAFNVNVNVNHEYSAESWSISTALCALSNNAEISSSSTVVWNSRCWAPGHGDYPVVSSRPSELRQRRSDDQEYWAGVNVV